MKDYNDEYYDNPNQRIIEDSTYMFIETLNSVEGKDVYIDDILAKAYITNSSNPNNENKEERTISVLIEQPIKTGSYIKGYDEGVYLVVSGVDDHISHKEAKIRKCNYILKWTLDGKYYEIPAIVTNNTKYTGGIKVQNGFTEIDAMVNITTQMNEDTKKIDYGKRLYTMKNAWKVTLIDNITTENVLSWTLGKDSLNSEIDDIEGGICDAFEHLYAISLNSNSQTLVETETFKIIPNVTDNGSLVLNPNVIYTSSDESIAKVDNTGLVTAISIGTCDITCSIGNVNEVLNLTINAKPVTPVISYSCDWSTAKTSTGCSLKTYMSSTVILKKTINGVDDSTLMANYTLDSTGSSLLSNGAITITRKTNNSFLVKNVNISTSKNFVMTFTDSSDGTIITTQTIQLTGM